MDERNNHFDFDFTPIGQAIKKAREAKGMTREQLSGIIGYAPRHIQSIENEGQYDRKVNPTPEKVVGHSVTITIFRWQEQYLWLVFGYGNRRRLPVCRNTCEHFHGFHKAILSDLNEIIKGRNTAKTSRPPVPLTIGNLQAVVFFRAIDITCHTL